MNKKTTKKTAKKIAKRLPSVAAEKHHSRISAHEAAGQIEERQIAVIEPQPVPVVTEQKILDYMEAFGISKQLLPNEKNQFIEIATTFGLNPFKREIYCVAYGEGQYRSLSIITGYQVYLKWADRTGKLDGHDCLVSPDGKEATATIWRKDQRRPTIHTVYYDECVQTKRDGSINKFWKKMPKFMLKKVCLAQAFRLAFPDELGGMPYTADELPEEMTTPKDVTPPKPTPKPTLVSPVEVKGGQSDTSQEFHKRNEASNELGPRNVSFPKEEKAGEEYVEIAPEKPVDPIATNNLKAFVETLDWSGKDSEYSAVINTLDKGVGKAHAANIRTRIEGLRLPAKEIF